MRIKNFNVIVVLLAEILVAIYALVYDYNLKQLVYTMLIVFVVFLLIGTLLQKLMNNVLVRAEEGDAIEEKEGQSMTKPLLDEELSDKELFDKDDLADDFTEKNVEQGESTTMEGTDNSLVEGPEVTEESNQDEELPLAETEESDKGLSGNQV